MTAYKDKNDYIRRLFASETPQLRATRESLTDPNDRISVEPEEGKLLQLLAGLTGAKKVLEIGTLGGYAALWMADAGCHVTTIEKDPARAARARANIGTRADITLIEGDAVQALEGIDDIFDMVFIDADKLNYLHYLDWAESHVRKNGLIIGDNTLLFDAVWHDAPVPRVRETARAAMRRFNERLADPARYRAIMLPTAAGMTIAQKLF